MSTEDKDVLTSVTLEQTNDIAMSIDEVLHDKSELIKVLTNETKERTLLVKELLMNAYVRGFFAGMQHTLADINQKLQSTNEEDEGQQIERSTQERRQN